VNEHVARISLLDEPRVGHAAQIEMRLLQRDGSPADPGLPLMMLVVESRATVAPAIAEYLPSGPPARFAFTAAEAGAHRVRITVYDRGYGVVLQDLAVVVDVKADDDRKIR
jgi:hypothetical protein